MSQPNIEKRKVRGPDNIKKHQPKKEYSLRSKHNTKTATVSEISHSGERAQQTMNEERLLFDQNKNPSGSAKPNDPNLTSNGGYDHQANNENGGNGYDHADSQSGRYEYDHQADNQYDGNGYDYADDQCGRYGYDHQADNQYDKYGYDHQADYQCSGHECNYRADDHDGGVIKQIMKEMGSIDALVAIIGTIFIVIVATYLVNTSREIIRTTLTYTNQNKTKSLEGVV